MARFERGVAQSLRLDRACGVLEAALFAASAVLIARTALRADAARFASASHEGSVVLDALCAIAAAWIAWRERAAGRAQWLARWDARLELRGALLTAHEHRNAASWVARALLARVGRALPSSSRLCAAAPLPYAALAVAAAAVALWWGTTPLVGPPWRAPAAELTALARGVAVAEARLGPTRAAAIDSARSAEVAPRAASRDALESARTLLTEAASALPDPALCDRARDALEQLRASGALDDPALPSARADGAADVRASIALPTASSAVAASSALGAQASLDAAHALAEAARLRASPEEQDFAERWAERVRALEPAPRRAAR